jgi:transcriptional regulator GlxA family with amidase domain
VDRLHRHGGVVRRIQRVGPSGAREVADDEAHRAAILAQRNRRLSSAGRDPPPQRSHIRYTPWMQIAILTFEGFNEIDSFVAASILNRVKRPGWKAEITAPSPVIASMNGVRVERQQPLAFAREADVVLVGSGRRTREIVEDPAIMSELRFDPARQLVTAQCSGALVLAKLGHLRDVPACTDLVTKPWVIEAGVRVAEQPFHASGNVATAGGCLASYYLASWIIARTAGREVAAEALGYVTPVGEQAGWASRAFAAIEPYL